MIHVYSHKDNSFQLALKQMHDFSMFCFLHYSFLQFFILQNIYKMFIYDMQLPQSQGWNIELI